jgi:hypothetical protein
MIARRLNRLAVDHVLYEPLGVHLAHHAWPKAVSAIVKARCPCSGASARPRGLRWAPFQIRRGDSPADSTEPVCTARVRCWPNPADFVRCNKSSGI